MPSYTILLQDTAGVYSLANIWRGGTTNNSGGTALSLPPNTPSDPNPFLAGLVALLVIKNDKAAGN